MKAPKNNLPKIYRVQTLLIDDTGADVIRTVIDSFLTDDRQKTLDFAMKRHKNNNKYWYVVIDVETQEIIYKSKENKYYEPSEGGKLG